MNIQQLRQSLKIKWVSYYYKNRSWLVKMRIWRTYEGQRRPSSSFILATLSTLEPQLEQIFPFILDLNNNPDKIVTALGLNFNPEEQLNLVKDNFVAENQDLGQFSVDTFVTEKPPSKDIRDRGTPEPQVQDALPCSQTHAGDRETFASYTSLTKIQIKDKPVSSVTPVTEDRGKSPAKQIPHKPVIPIAQGTASKAIAIATEVQNKSELTTPIALTKVESHSVIPITFATTNEITSKPLASVAVATKIENRALLNNGMIEVDAEKQRRGDTVIIVDANSKIIPQLCNTGNQTHSVIPIAVAAKIDPHRQYLATSRPASTPTTAPVYYPRGGLEFPVGAESPRPIYKTESDAVIPIANAYEIESQDKLVSMEQKDIPNHQVNLSPTNKVCKLANWIDDFCQGTGWDREEAIFIPF